MGPIGRFLSEDHARLDGLLRQATATSGRVDLGPYGEFRAGLLKHIAMEEKILLPEAQRRRGGDPLPVAGRLRLDHGAIAALLVPTPTHRLVTVLRSILEGHNRVEEGPGGFYAACDELAGEEADALVERLRNTPEVRVAAHSDGPLVLPAVRRALERAGYEAEAKQLDSPPR